MHGVSFFQEIIGFTSILAYKRFSGCPKKIRLKYNLFGKNQKLRKILQFWSLKLKQSPRLIGNYFCRNGIFFQSNWYIFSQGKWIFHKFHSAHTPFDCLNFKIFFFTFYHHWPFWGNKNHNFCFLSLKMNMSLGSIHN